MGDLGHEMLSLCIDGAPLREVVSGFGEGVLRFPSPRGVVGRPEPFWAAIVTLPPFVGARDAGAFEGEPTRIGAKEKLAPPLGELGRGTFEGVFDSARE